jgi:lysophospholipase L1-like esterase
MTYHLAGDSTVAECPTDAYPMSGWGAHLTAFVDAPVRNLAFGGATTETFLQERWEALIADVSPEDTVLIQFGHNDQKLPDLLHSRGGYAERLRRMVKEARSRGAVAVLCTPCERRWFQDDRVTPTHGDYPNTVRDLAKELDTPLIDLTVFTTWLYEDLGPERSAAMLSNYAPGTYPNWPEGLADDTHFHEQGAKKIAAFVARSLRAIERKDGNLEAKGSLMTP